MPTTPGQLQEGRAEGMGPQGRGGGPGLTGVGAHVCPPGSNERLHAEVTSPSFLSVSSLGHRFLGIPNKTQFIIILNIDLYIVKKRALSSENCWALG